MSGQIARKKAEKTTRGKSTDYVAEGEELESNLLLNSPTARAYSSYVNTL